MTDLLRKFLLDDLRRLSPNGRFVGLAAFGKHPGWDDHVEDLGLETDSLNHAKTAFYVNGIGGQIDSGAWEKLDSTQQLPGFKHLFLWQRSGQMILGRLWSSSDGKGRKRYPMVVCLHFAGVTLRWALMLGLPALAELEEQLQKTNSAEEVRSVLNRKRASLREGLNQADARGEYAPVSPEALRKILHPATDSNSQGFLRVLYQMQSQFRNFAPGIFNSRVRTGTIRAQQIRVPAAGENPQQILLFWSRFFLTQMDSSVPLLMCLPLDENWVDITAGDPESHEFFALRASPKAVPLVSEVPYTLDEDFLSKARAFLKSFEQGETSTLNVTAEQPAAAASAAPSKGGWLKWLGVGVVVIAAAVAGVVFLGKGKHPANNQAATEKPSISNASAQTAAAATPAPAITTQATPIPKPEPPPTPTEQPRSVAVAKPTNEPPVVPKPKEVSISATQTPKATLQENPPAPQKPVEPIALVKPGETPAASTTSAPPVKPPASEQTLAALTPTPEPGISTPPPLPIAPVAPVPGAQMTNSVGMVLVLMPSGVWVGKYEVTRGEYSRVMETTVSDNQNERLPVNRVAWDDANEFCRRLTEKESAKLKGKVYSLPTQKQWEEFSAGQKLEELPAGSLKTSLQEPALVTETSANKLGLYGVLGNVWEWCLDGGGETSRLQKGGEYNSTNYNRLVAPSRPRPNSGFRCVLVQK